MKAFFLFHCSIGLVYLFSFLSLYWQYPGLFSYNGISPAENFVQKLRGYYLKDNSLASLIKLPSLTVYASEIGLSTDAINEFLIITGSILSSVIAAGYHSSVLFFIVWFCYLSLFIVGMETFLSFQWDILLLETGFLAIFTAPYLFYRIEKIDSGINEKRDVGVNRNSIVHCLRFLAWKLMFMSGVVKLQAQCPTWEALSALEYHFASQCIPTPLAWFAHQLPPILLRFSVAATLLIEIPLSFLLLAPTVVIRRYGVIFQIILQVSIFMTGNYNFFNLLTIALMIPSYSDENLSYIQEDREETLVEVIDNSFPSVLYIKIMRSINKSKFWSYIQMITCITFTIISSYYMFDYRQSLYSHDEWWKGSIIKVKDNFWKDKLEPVLQIFCAFTIYYSLFNIICYTFHDIGISWDKYKFDKEKSILSPLFLNFRLLQDLFISGLSIIWIFLASIPLSSICNVKPFIPKAFEWLSDYLSGFHITSGYGLFRKLTGVGKSSRQNRDISVVARPEVVLEGLDPITQKWKEIPFKFKPTNLFESPRFVAPDQPRLDWQMWFAALSSYQNNPWLIHLIYKLLSRKSNGANYVSDDVIRLLDIQNYPFNLSHPPLAIRADLYDYDFTRLNTSWAVRTEGAVIVSSINSHSNNKLKKKKWWKRTNKREYIPALSIPNESIENFLKSHNIQINKDKSIDEMIKICMKTKNKLNIKQLDNFIFKHTVCSSLKLREIKINPTLLNLNISMQLHLICLSVFLVTLITCLLIRRIK